MQIIGLYSGKLSHIGPRHSPTGIYKWPIERVLVNASGIVGDVQADKRFHGGPQKALHQFALSSYEKIIKRFPLLHTKALPGSMGENLCATDMHDANVCIGDIYQVGSCLLQVSAPRIPCSKIDQKFKQTDMNILIRHRRLTGWYYRVLEQGQICLHDDIVLLDRLNPQISIDAIMNTLDAQAGALPLELAINASGLDPQWQHKLRQANS